MGSEGEGNPNQVKRLYTLILKGGKPFEFFVPFSGAVEHDGVHSLHHVYCTKETLDMILSEAEASATVHYESENEEQRAERSLLHRQDLDKIFPTSECGSCFWFDLSTENMCGAKDWEEERKKASLEFHQEALRDLNRCPIVRSQTCHRPKEQ